MNPIRNQHIKMACRDPIRLTLMQLCVLCTAFDSKTLLLFPEMKMDCVNITEMEGVSTFMVKISTTISRVLIIPDRDIRESIGKYNSCIPMVLYCAT